MSTTSVDIELALRDAGGHAFCVDAILQLPGGNADVCLARDVSISLDRADLRARTLNPASYGAALTQMLFSPPQLRDAWIKATTYVAAAEVPLRVRLRIDPAAEALHSLRWETLCDPETQRPLCFSRRILLSRYLASAILAACPC